jgi:outer membrane autotransporter protein
MAFQTGSDAVFAATSQIANGSYTVTLDANLTVGNITYRGGDAGSTLQIAVGTGSTIQISNVNPPMAVAVDLGTTLTIAPTISGTAGLSLTNSGTLVLSGVNTYSGGTTIGGGGILSVANDNNLGDASGGLILQNGALLTTANFTTARTILVNAGIANSLLSASGTTATYQGVVSGSGALQIGGSTFDQVGTVVLTNPNNSYQGGTAVLNNAVLMVDSDAELGNISGDIKLRNFGELLTTAAFTSARNILLNPSLEPVIVVNPAKPLRTNILAASSGSTANYTGPISGTAGLQVGDEINQGTIVLSGNNTYTGGTNILPGTLEAASNNAMSTGPVQISGGMFMINDGVTLANPVTFAAAGALVNYGTLNNSVLDQSTHGGFVVNIGTINGNVLLSGSENLVGLLTGSRITGNLALNAPNSLLILAGLGQQLLSQAVVGTLTESGSLVKQDAGTWTIDRPLDAPLGTEITGGILVLEAALTTAQVNVSSGATLQLNTGGTIGNLVDSGSLVFAGSATVILGGIISGPGNLVQSGAGTTILGGKNIYSGGTVIDLGTLIVDNPQALGTGNVVVNGGVLGADPQPINVLGNYTQNAGGTLQLTVAGRAAGQFDVLNVTGNAALNGTLQLLNLGYQPHTGDQVRLITTGGVVSGRFSQFLNPFTPAAGFNTIDLVYARKSVTLEFLTLLPPVLPPVSDVVPVVITTDFSSFALTPNQLASANLLDAVQLDPKAISLISFLNQEPFSALPNNLQKISPEGLSAFFEIGFSNANIQRLNLESRMDDIRNGSNGFNSNMKVNGATVNDKSGADGKSSKVVVEPILQHLPENRWGVWVTGFGDFVSVDGDANANGYNFTTGGATLGLDYRLTDQLVIGVMGDYSHTWTSLQPSGHIDVDSGRGGLYATWYSQGFYLEGAIYGGHNNYDSSRAGLGGLATGGTEGSEWSTFITGGYDFHFGLLTVGPIASLQYTSVHIDDFSENGSLAPLTIHSDSAESLRSDVGFRVFYQWQIGKVVLEPSLKAAWEHEYKYSALPITAGFAGVPGPSATFYGPSEGHDSAVVSAGLSAQWTPAIATYVNYDGQLGRANFNSNAVTGGVRISF